MKKLQLQLHIKENIIFIGGGTFDVSILSVKSKKI